MTEPEAIDTAPEPAPLALAAPVEIGPGRWRIAPVGEIDLSNAATLVSSCDGLADRDGVTLEIDLAGVSYLDSSGIGAMVTLLRSLESRGGGLRITNPSGIVGRILELSGLLPLLGITSRRSTS